MTSGKSMQRLDLYLKNTHLYSVILTFDATYVNKCQADLTH